MKECDIKAHCEQVFKTHKAKILADDGRYLIIDWRREDGGIHCYVNYIVDKKRGALIVSGDLGDSIAVWYNSVTPEKLKDWIKDIGYYIKKIQCSSDLYDYDSDDVIEDMKEYIDNESVEEYAESRWEYDSAEEVWAAIEAEVLDSVFNNMFFPSEGLREIIKELDQDYWEWISSCGRRINIRVYMWAIGFRMAYEQLEQQAAKELDELAILSALGKKGTK